MRRLAANTADTMRYVLVGAPRNLVSVDGEYSVDLAIYECLIESGSGSCLMRTTIECFSTQDDHVIVGTVQSRLTTMVKSELYKCSAVAEKEKLKIDKGYVRSICQGMRHEVETAPNDVAWRPANDRFVVFVHGVEVKEPPTTTTNQNGPTSLKHVVDETKPQSCAKTPRLKHIWRRRHIRGVPLRLKFRQQRCASRGRWQVFHVLSLAFGWRNSPCGMDGRCTDEVA